MTALTTPEPASAPRARASVVIPAHNEQSVVGRCLESILAEAAAGEFEVIVVCNGCSDETAAVARGFGQSVRVIETQLASKPLALNLGDQNARAFPRIYVDADVVLSTNALRRVVEVLTERGALAAAPRLRLELEGVPWPVRCHSRIWLRLPFVTDNHIGSGVIGLSEEGRARFSAFPETFAEDLFVRDLFHAGERRSLADVTFAVRPPRTLRSFVRVKSRIVAANRAYRRGEVAGTTKPVPTTPSSIGLLMLLATDPRVWFDICVYLALRCVIGLAAYLRRRRGVDQMWERDDTARTEPRPARADP